MNANKSIARQHVVNLSWRKWLEFTSLRAEFQLSSGARGSAPAFIVIRKSKGLGGNIQE